MIPDIAHAPHDAGDAHVELPQALQVAAAAAAAHPQEQPLLEAQARPEVAALPEAQPLPEAETLPEAQAAVVVPREPRMGAGGRMEMRGKLTLSAVFKGGEQIGWGANCGICQSVNVQAPCKKQLPYGGKRTVLLDDDQCRRKLKKWLTLCVASDDREAHVKIDARALPFEDEAELDATLNIMRASL